MVWCRDPDIDSTCIVFTCVPVGGTMAVAGENVTGSWDACHFAYREWLAAF